MATIASLNVLLNANTGKYQKKMKGAQRSATQFKAAIGLAKTAMAAFGVTIAGAAVIGGIRNMIDELDRLGKLSARLNTTADALAGIQFAAQRSGISVNDMNSSLERFNRRIAEASLGTGEAIKTLDQLGLSASRLDRMRLDRRVGLVSQRISELATSGLRANAAFKLFGDTGFKLMNLINLGEDGIKKLTDRFEELNGKFSDAAVRAQAAKDAMLDLEVIQKRWTRELTVSALPAIRGFTSALTDMGVQLGSVIHIITPLTAVGTIYDDLKFKAELAAKGAVHLADGIKLVNAASFDGLIAGKQLIDNLREQIDLFGRTGFDRQLRKLIRQGDIKGGDIREATGLIGMLRSMQSQQERIGKARDAFNVPRLDLPPRLLAPSRGTFPLRPRPTIPAMGGDGASASIALATRAVDATGGNSISSELSARQATEAERTRIQEKILEEMKRNTTAIVQGLKLLDSRIEDDPSDKIGG